ncbi:hypothetical protein BC834DRAFT_878123, partial [Gloeopeniophorella convolvens]
MCATTRAVHISPHTLRRYVLHPTVGDTLQGSPPLCYDTRLAALGVPSSRACRAPCKTLAALARRAADVPALPVHCRARYRQHRAPRVSRYAARHAASMHHSVPSSAALHEARRCRPRLTCGTWHMAPRCGARRAPSPPACPTGGSTAPAEGTADAPAGIPASSAPRRSVARLRDAVDVVIAPEGR